MPSEKRLRQLACEKMTAQGFIPWFAPRVRWGHERDLWDIFDGIFLIPPAQMIPFQITTYSNISARRKKINNFFEKNNVNLYCEIWAWQKKYREFKIINIYGWAETGIKYHLPKEGIKK